MLQFVDTELQRLNAQAAVTGQVWSQAWSQTQPVSDMDFLVPPGDTFKFS